VVTALGVMLALATTARSQQAGRPEEVLPEQAAKQIAALQAEKAKRTPAQRKVSSSLLYARKIRRGEPVAEGVTFTRQTVAVDGAGRVSVDLVSDVTGNVLGAIEAAGGVVVNSVSEYRAIRAEIPLDRIEAIAALPEVQSIRPADRYMTNQAKPSGPRRPAPPDQPITNKVNTSQGDVAHRAALARSTFGVDGTGIGIGVISDGIATLAARQASGDVPTVTVIPGQAGSGDEGTAMLEIVHDLAPGATLYFATANGGQAQFAANIQALCAAGARIIVDDVGYFAEAVFQDGIVAQGVNAAVGSGCHHFSAAGNSGNKNDGTSGVWEGDFVAGTTPPVLAGAGTAHSFPGGFNSNLITQDSPYGFALQWSDAQGASANDYDLYLLDNTLSSVIIGSADFQTGTQNPFEFIDSSGGIPDLNNRLVIVLYSGSARYLHLDTIRGRLSINTSGQTSGHSAAANAFGVAAVNVSTAGGGAFVGGGANPVETYSSDGLRRIFYNPNGTAITPGNFLSTGGTLLQKPDLAAADCVATATPGFNPFCGTSAAAPHAAAIAALMLDAAGGPASMTLAQLRTKIAAASLDIEAAGIDRDSGTGILDALNAVSQSLPPVTIAINDVTQAEGNAGGTTFTFNVALSGPAPTTVTVNWATAANSATTPSDFATASGMVTFNMGESSKPVNITVNGDTAYETNETFFVNLSAPSGATISDSQGVGTITNDDAMPTIAIGDVSMLEGNAGSQVYAFTVSLSPASGIDVTVDWATFTVTATAGSDFAGTGGSLLFTPGQTAKLVNVTVNGDTLYETTEIFSVNLSNLVGATYADFQGIGTITNDDTMPSLSINDVTLAEGGTGSTTNFPFTVTLSAASGVQTTVNFATANVTAISGSDYVAQSGMLTFAPGETTKPIDVTVNGDGMLEANEVFNVGLSGAMNATIADATGVGTITNDDVAPSRVFVATTGLDTNDCSNIATPCRTLNAAIAQVATDGEAIVIGSGSYAGATVDKGVKIDVAAGVVAFSGQPVTVNAPGGNVVIRGLTLKAVTPGTGTGLSIVSAAAVFLENSVIDGWQIGVENAAPELFITDSTIRNNSTGLHVSSGMGSIDNSRFTNSTGSAIDIDAGSLSVRNSTLSGNLIGIQADGGSFVAVEKAQLSNNGTGISLPGPSTSTVRLSRSVVSGNGIGLVKAGSGTLFVAGNNVLAGNTVDSTGTLTFGPLQ
jgi:hypothetical protein